MTTSHFPGMGDRLLTGQTLAQSQSYPGMAHFAGTGPKGRQCKDCIFATKPTKSKGHPVIACTKYKQLTKDKVDRKFPPGAWACRHFEWKGKNNG